MNKAISNTDSVFTGTATALGLPKAIGARVLYRTWGLKQYELSNHLGNVQVTVSDKKIGVVGSNNVDFTSYQADVKSATDYYAYGMEMPGKSYQSTAYRYGMNTQEKDNEIYGPGNTFGALHWEFDARIARRWNVDPVVVPSLSNYHAFEGNPIMLVDPLGNSAGIFKKDPNTGKETKVSDFGDRQGFDIVLTGNTNEDGSMNQEGVKTEVYDVVDGARVDKTAQSGGTVTSSKKENEGGFGGGFVDGFGSGIGGTIDFFASLGTTQGWKGLGQGMLDMAMLSCQTCPQGMMMRTQMADGVINYVQNIPNMSAYEMGYDLGFGSEKALEIAITGRTMPIPKTALGVRNVGDASRFSTIQSVNTFRKWGTFGKKKFTWTTLGYTKDKARFYNRNFIIPAGRAIGAGQLQHIQSK